MDYDKQNAIAQTMDAMASASSIDVTNIQGQFKYFTQMVFMLNDLYHKGYSDGFEKAVNIDVNK